MRAAAVAGAAALLLSPATLGGCGSGDSDAGGAATEKRSDEVVDISGTDPVGQKLGGSVAQLVTCRDWRGANEEERLATIADIRRQLAPQDSGIELPQLTDEEAARVFDSSCRIEWAGGFRLYKLYAQAAGFVTLERELEAAGDR
jgi:hypothetical protein